MDHRRVERHLAVVRQLIGYAERLSLQVRGTHEDEQIQDCIEDAQYLLKQLGGVASRSERAGGYMALSHA